MRFACARRAFAMTSFKINEIRKLLASGIA